MSSRSAAGAAGVVVATLGGLVLAGWALDLEAVKSVLPGLVAMKANTALAFVLAGLSLWLQAREGASARRWWVARAAALSTALIGSLTLLEYVAGLDLGIDQLLFEEAATALATSSPGRMAPATAFAFLALGLALLLLDTATRRGWRPAEALGLVAAAVAFTGLLGYLLRVPSFAGIGSYWQMALHTTWGILALVVGIMLARADRGVMSLVTAPTAGGVVVRRLMPLAVVVPVALAWLRFEGQRLGLYGTEFGLALYALADVGVLSAAIVWIARSLDALDRARKDAHQALVAAEARFRGLVEAAPDAIIGTDAEGRILLVNRRTEETFGYSRDELIGQPEQVLLLEHLRILDSRPGPVGRRKDGSEFPVEISSSPLESPDGMVALALLRDVTQRQLAGEALRESESRFRQLAEGLPLLVWTCKPDGPCDYLSPQWVAYTGIPEAEQLGSGWLEQLHPEDRAPTFAAWTAAVEAGSNLDVDFRIRGADGAYRWFKTRGVPLKDGSGRLVKWFGTNTDIHDRIEAQEQLRRSAAELERSNQDLQEFAFVASHDLQEPLRKITAFGERLRERAGDALDEQARDYLARMERAAERMEQLIESLLDLSRVTTKAQPFAPTSLEQVVREVLADLDVRIRQTGARVDVGPLPTIAADPLQMRRLVQNLVLNALKFREADKPPVIAIGSEALDGGLWRITVTDNGIGFEEKYLDRIFKPFQRLHGRGQFEGSGMGLAICKKIAGRHGGEITARSRPGEGSTFILTLPDTPLAKGAERWKPRADPC